jgi:hypothetical protein
MGIAQGHVSDDGWPKLAQLRLAIRVTNVGLLKIADAGRVEGLVSKRRDWPYQAGRSKAWVKIKNREHPAMSRVMEAFS